MKAGNWTSILRIFVIVALFLVLGPGSVQSQTCKVEKFATLPLSYSNHLVAAAVSIRGKEVMMAVDTGAQTLVTPGTASRFHLPPDPHRTTRVISPTGTRHVTNVFLRDLEFAGKRYDYKTVAAVDLPVFISFGGKSEAGLAGLIGADVLGEYDVDLDLAGQSMTLYKVRGCVKVPLPWTEPYTALEVKITSQKNVLLPVEVDGHKLSGLLDTGATGFAITRQASLKAGATGAALKADPLQQITSFGGTSTQPAHKFGALTIGGETFRDIYLQLTAARLMETDVFIGQSYLRFRRVWISYSTRMLFVGKPKISPSLPLPAAPSMAFEPNPFRRTPPLVIPCVGLQACGFGPAAAPAFSPVPALPLKPAETPNSQEAAKSKEQLSGLPPAAPSAAPEAAGAGRPRPLIAALPKHEGGCPAMQAPLVFAPRRGIVVGYMTRYEAIQMMKRSQAAAQREISPKYVMNGRIKVRTPARPRYRWVTVVLPKGMPVRLGDRIEFLRAREDPEAPCRYIPNLAVKIIPPD